MSCILLFFFLSSYLRCSISGAAGVALKKISPAGLNYSMSMGLKGKKSLKRNEQKHIGALEEDTLLIRSG